MWTTSLQSLTRSNTAWTRCKRWTNKDKCCAEKWNNGNYSRGHSRQRDKPARVLRQFWGCGFKVNKSPMLLFWIIRLFWKPLHFFILLFFYQTNSKSLRSAWKRSFDVLIKKYTKLQILFYLNFWSEKKKNSNNNFDTNIHSSSRHSCFRARFVPAHTVEEKNHNNLHWYQYNANWLFSIYLTYKLSSVRAAENNHEGWKSQEENLTSAKSNFAWFNGGSQ